MLMFCTLLVKMLRLLEEIHIIPYLCLVQSMKRGEIPNFLIHSDPMFGYRTCAWLQCQPAAACLTGILSPTNRGFKQAIFDLQKEG